MADYKTPQWLLPNEKNLAYPASGDGITGSGLSEDRHSLYSMEFDGTDDYIDCGTSSELEITGDVTISAWVYITTGSAYQGIVCKRDSGGTNYQLYTDNSATPLLRFYDGATATSSTGTVSLNAWHHVAITVDSGVTNGSIFYIDGVASGTATFTITSDDANLLIGALDTGSIGSYFNGKIDEVSIWNKALNQSEIDALSVANAPANLMALSAKPIAYYPLGEQAQMGYSNWNFPNGSLQSHVVDFDGSSNITLPDIPFLRGGGQNFSVSAWVNTTSGTQVAYFGSRVAPSSTNTIYFWRNVPGGVVLNINNSSTGNIEARSSVTLSNNEWHHVAATFDGSEPVATDRIKIYIDGVLSVGYQAGTGTNLPSGTTGVFNFIGALNIGLNQTGEMSNVAIWDSTLIGSEITTLYNNGVPYAGTQPQSANLQGWWKLNAADSSYVYPWTMSITGAPDYTSSNDGCYISSGVLKWRDTGTPAAFTDTFDWYSKEITGANTNITISSTGGEWQGESSSIGLRLFYKIDGGSWVQFQEETHTGGYSPTAWTLTAPAAQSSSSSFQLKVVGFGGASSNSYVTLNDITVTADAGTLYTESFTDADGTGFANGVYTPPPVDWTFIDSSGSNNGTSDTLPTSALIPSDLQFESPYSNYSLSFDGIDDYVEIPSGTLFDFGSNPFSFSGWFTRGNTAVGDDVLFFNRKSTTIPNWQIRQNVNNIQIEFNVGGVWSAVTTTTNPIAMDTNWHHLVITKSGTSASIYIDGVAQATSGTAPGTIDAGDGTSFISSRNGVTQEWFGKIDETAIFNKELTQAEVSSIYNNGYPADLTSLSPVSWWRLGEDAYFVSNVVTIPNKITSGPSGTGGGGDQSAFLVGEAPGSYSNGLGSSLDVFDRIGDAPESTANSVSINMIPSNRISYPAGYVPTQVDNVYSMAFDGVNDYVNIGTISSVNSASACTISYWGKKAAASGDDMTVGSQITSTNGIWLQWYTDNIVYFSPRNGGTNTVSVALTGDTNWHHFVGVYDGTNMTIYIDGTQAATSTTLVPSSLSATAGDNFQIGALNGSFLTSGNIDEVAIFDYALSARQIKQDIYNGTTPGKTADLNNISNLTAPVAWYRMGD